jgi:thiol:disulfide interchange protein DsbC
MSSGDILMDDFFGMSKIVNRREINGLCEIIMQIDSRFYPCYVGENYVIFGKMFSDGKFVSQRIIQKVQIQQQKKEQKEFISRKKELDRLVAIVYKPSKTSKKVLYMFTDPLCPFCHKAEAKIKELVEKYNMILKIIFYSVHPPEGTKKAIEAICRKFNLDQYLSEEWRKKTENFLQCNKGKNILKKSSSLASTVGITGVPTFIYEDGTRIIGARVVELENMLRQK